MSARIIDFPAPIPQLRPGRAASATVVIFPTVPVVHIDAALLDFARDGAPKPPKGAA